MSIKPRVLVVDDDEVIASTTSMILNDTGFDSVAAFGGEEALNIARGQSFDMLLTDVVMDPMNGIELAVAFLDIHPSARVLLFTGTTEAAQPILDAMRSRQNFPVLQKPIHPRDLIERLRSEQVG